MKMEKKPSSPTIHSLGGEHCWIVRDSEPIRLLKSPNITECVYTNIKYNYSVLFCSFIGWQISPTESQFMTLNLSGHCTYPLKSFSLMAWACSSQSTGNHYRQYMFWEAFPTMVFFFCVVDAEETISLSMSLSNNALGSGSSQSIGLYQWPVPCRNSQNTWPQSKVWLENHLPSGWALPFLCGFYTVCKSEIWNVDIIINYTWTFHTKPNQCVFIGKNQKE